VGLDTPRAGAFFPIRGGGDRNDDLCENCSVIAAADADRRWDRRSPRRRDGGAAAVEFALILPIFLAVLFGVIDYGWYFYQRFALSAAIRDGIKAGLPVLSTNVAPVPDAWTVARDRALVVLKANAIIPSPDTTVTFGPTTHYSGAAPEKLITLSASYTFKPLIGFVPMPKVPMTYSMTMMLELEN
jgi:hypothetical protein